LAAGLALLLAFGPLVAVPVARLERWRLRLVHPPITGGHRPTGRGVLAWVRARYTEPATWRAFAYLLLLFTVVDAVSWSVLYLFPALGAYLLATPAITALGRTVTLFPWAFDAPGATLPLVLAGAVLLLVTPYVAAVTAHAHAVLARLLLEDHGTEELRSELVEVTRSRARLVDAFETERRRIERDLHDGAQQRLLALTMTLTRARARLSHDPDGARELITEAQAESREVMTDLRQVARGLHPRVLTDHGLGAALPVAVGRSPVPVRLDVDLAERPSARAEGVAYYVVCEALTNIAKHADAEQVTVAVGRVPAARRGGELLCVTVTDDGVGGADPEAGTGLYGLWDRVDAVDGELTVHSPTGGGTVLTA
ncbi:sensor domain-containing protein, partial [Streptomyces sp. NPDC000931]|uniref:sensor histidine kinase n=1 Tax=Streptomyces sp. NPDC000931 TaxID=3154372 RepID=UPI00331ADF4B